MENPKSYPKEKPHAILVQLPYQGQIIPFIQLAIKLASKGFAITFINADHIHHKITHNNPIATAHDSGGDIFSEARTSWGLDIDYITVGDGLPRGIDRSSKPVQRDDIPAHVEAAVANIVRSRPSTCCLIVDSYLRCALKLAKKFELCHVSFWSEAAMVLDLYFHVHLLKEHGHVGCGSSGRNDVIDYIPGINSIKRSDLTSYLQEEDLTTIPHQCILPAMEDAKRADFILGNTVQELEAHAISGIQTQTPFYAIGPLFAPGFTKSPVATSLWAESDCIQWLNTKPHGSVLYVSFGSYAHISREEFDEIANGIKLSGVNFLWVIRPDMLSSDDLDPLPSGFRDEVRNRGMIVTWTSQTMVLSHGAIGGFLTHCGWNSTLEGIWCEVPFLCFPLLTDQFTNRKLIVEDWKVGCNVCEEKPVKRAVVMQTIKDMFGGSIGYELKEKIKGLKQLLENAITSDGSSEKNIDGFFGKLRAVVDKKQGQN